MSALEAFDLYNILFLDIETVPCVADFEELDDKAIRKLFVGATRAMMKLVLVLSETSAARLLAALNEPAATAAYDQA